MGTPSLPGQACEGGARAGAGGREGEGSHLGLLAVVGLDANLHAPHADLQDAAGRRVKVHGEPACGGNLRARDTDASGAISASSCPRPGS